MSRADETIRAPQRVWAVATAAEDEPGEQRLGTPSAVDAIVRMVLADCSGHINVLLRNLLLLRLYRLPQLVIDDTVRRRLGDDPFGLRIEP